jgi:alpha/beta superfamily hydrolase
MQNVTPRLLFCYKLYISGHLIFILVCFDIMVEITFSGPEGRIEGRYHSGGSNVAALVLHPHPLHGGTMNNKVLYRLYQSFAKFDVSVLRINFRGVGRSVGQFGNGIGELADAASALDWLQLQNPNATDFWVGGFSFGSWIAMQLLMRRPEIIGFIAVSPPADKYDFSFLAPCPAPGLVVQGDNDSVVSEETVHNLVNKLSSQCSSDIDYNVVNGADHFYRNKLEELDKVLHDYLKERLLGDKSKDTKPKFDRRKRRS